MDKFDAFFNKNADTKLTQYTTSGQKRIARLLEKDVFKVVTSKNILKNVEIFNFCFIDKIKNSDMDMTYKKSRVIVQVYNN